MKRFEFSWKRGIILFAWSLPALLLLEGVRLLAGSPFSLPGTLIRLSFILGVLISGRLALPQPTTPRTWIWPWPGLILVGLGLLSGIAFALGVEIAAWSLTLLFFANLLAFEKALESGNRFLSRFALRCLAAGLAGGFAIAVAQVESRFSEEEFFVALQALALAAFWLVLSISFAVLVKSVIPLPPSRISENDSTSTLSATGWVAAAEGRISGIHFRPSWLAQALVIPALAGALFTIRSYQYSFYPARSPGYAQITEDQPFKCGKAPADPQVYAGKQIFNRILKRVEANPYRGAPEYGMLALGTGELRWAQAFRQSLLEEAAAGRFTEPAQSVKYGQYEAAQRAYYYPRVRQAFPSLFSPSDEALLQAWFYAINRRALTVEWVDWLYALAFSKWPEGPYENQENGAGLLSILEAGGLADPALSTRNLDYLARGRRGWLDRFRVTDDAVVYQPEWMNNALYQSLFDGRQNVENQQRSFEWLLAQALPDGASLQYNHPGSISMADSAYPGANWLQDSRYLWLAGRAVEYMEAQDGILAAKPGLDKATDLNGASPETGSCLLYGDSGLPNQAGPLAPDKIVFRDGWNLDSAYLLLNLRFTGWHRYKATNTVTLLYQAGQLAADEMSGEIFTWLPSGRSFFRDKRVPRENLNGLAVERSGMGAVLNTLTGIGGPWAQDPPFYAQVESFTTGPEMDYSQTLIENWHGWTHRRRIYFYPNGPVVIFDRANGPQGQDAAFFWHVPLNGEDLAGSRYSLRSNPNPAEMLLLPISSEINPMINPGEDGFSTITVQLPERGELSLVTIFLTRQWSGAQATIHSEGGQQILQIDRPGDQILLPLP